MVGANVTLDAEHTERDLGLDAPVTLMESTLGLYEAAGHWPEAGLWALTVEVGAAERTDFARLGVLINAE